MDFFEEHKALIITTLLFLILLLIMYNINVLNAHGEVDDILIDLKEDQETEEEVIPEESKESPLHMQGPKTHEAFDLSREEANKVFQDRLNEILRKEAVSQEAPSEEKTGGNEGEYTISEEVEKKTNKSTIKENSRDKQSGGPGNRRNSTISFSLLGRSAVNIPNPVYTCDTPGKIVINIKVDADGNVFQTSFNSNSSTSTNACLITQALEYASEARFSNLPGRNAQPGTISFYFQD